MKQQALLSFVMSVGWLVAMSQHHPARAALRTVAVSNDSQLSAALTAALPEDEIVLADGDYAGFAMTKSGVGADPNHMIRIKAQHQGGAVINSGVIHFNNTAYVTVEGMTITTPGANRSFDDVNWNVGVLFQGADHSRLTRSTIKLNGQPANTYWVMPAGDSDDNRIDHNEIGPDPGSGIYIYARGNPNIPGVTFTPSEDRGPWAHGEGPYNPNMARHTRIDHNYIHDHTTRESIILGGIGMTGDYQDTASIVEHNLFENNAGDSELISIKTSGSTIRYNTVRDGYGAIVNRAGNGSQIYGNVILAGGRDGSQGIRLHEMDHKVYNNYIENTDGFGIQVYEGDLYDESDGVSFTHAQVVNTQITHNTIVNPGGPAIQIGAGGNVLPPKDVTVANNILMGSGTLFTEHTSNPGINMAYSQNIIWPQNPNKDGFLVVNPQLTLVGELQKLSGTSPAINSADPIYSTLVTEDMDGQLRDALRDIGADEFSRSVVLLRPLTTADVGPLASSLDADLNMDGKLNNSDWAAFKAGQGMDFTGLTPVQSFLFGDLNGDLRHYLDDFSLFRYSYEETYGEGAFTRMLAGVPEPNTFWMLCLSAPGIASIPFCSRIRTIRRTSPASSLSRLPLCRSR
jgi:poly(beta-D-mannuronate) lyase